MSVLTEKFIEADDFIATHSCKESGILLSWPTTLHCKCGAEFTAANMNLMTDMFVRHLVMEAFAAKDARIAELERQAQVREIEARLDEAKWWIGRRGIIAHQTRYVPCECPECFHIAALSKLSAKENK